MEYLSLPLVLREGYLSRVSLEESIIYSVGLILSTRLGTLPFERGFGCDLWDKEFSDLMTSNKADIRASLRNAIDTFEKRLYNVNVTFSNTGGSGQHTLGMMVKVTGYYKVGNEEKKLEYQYGIG